MPTCYDLHLINGSEGRPRERLPSVAPGMRGAVRASVGDPLSPNDEPRADGVKYSSPAAHPF